MTLTNELIMGPLGRPKGSAELGEVAKALGEDPQDNVDGNVVFAGAGLLYAPNWDTGMIMTVRWPPLPDAATNVPFPRGIRAEMGDLAVRGLLGRPTATPIGIDFWGGFLPMDVFDLTDVTVQVVYDDACARVIGVLMATPGSVADLRERRAANEDAPIRRAKGGPSKLGEVLDEMRAAPRRDESLAAVMALLEQGPAQDLAALMRAHADHEHRPVHVGDYALEVGGFETEIPSEGGHGVREDRLCIGLTGGGDLWVVPWPPAGGDTTAVSLIVHDNDWLEQEDSDSLDGFFDKCEETA